jgi:hypothetical protein
MSNVVYLVEDRGFEPARYPSKIEQINQALAILGQIETLDTSLGDNFLWEASLALMNARNVLTIGMSNAKG